MKVLGVIGIIVAAIGILFSFLEMATTNPANEDMIGYGLFYLVNTSYLLAISIVGLRK